MKRHHSRYVLLASCVLAVACGDSPSEPPEPVSVSASSALPANPAAGSTVSPAVLVQDAAGRPIAGVTVTFAVTAGGGTVSSATAVTNTSGVATVPWTLGPAPGVNTLVAQVGDLPPFTFTVTTCGAYCIEIRFVGQITAAQELAFRNARVRWEEVISGNLPSVQMDIPAAACKDADGNALVNHPAVNEVVDDLLVYVQIDSIDGPGKVLGSAGPCFIRSTSRLPVFGIMRLDRADLTILAQNNLLNDVILHELGHVLGFPTIWSDPMFDLLEGAGTDEPYFTGSAGANRFTLAGGTLINGVGVPVENTGGEGTRDSHWREAVLSTELMTGFISTGGNPLSAITIGSLEDIGYQVNYAAGDPYSVPPAAGVMSGWSSLRLEMIEQPMPAPRVVN